jgi:hypothetical protein
MKNFLPTYLKKYLKKIQVATGKCEKQTTTINLRKRNKKLPPL